MAKQNILTSPDENFPQWYQDVLNKAALAEGGPVRGTMVIKPYGYGIWEAIQADVDARIKATGARNVYMPLFIPESYLQKEAEHVEGFSPELAVVTHAGGSELDEPVVVRPTSETIFGEYMAKWVQSHRDLPLLLNQWANVVRWELRPRTFLRTTEFLWQEGHTAHATQQDAADYAARILHEVYVPHMEQMLAVPITVGIKPPSERFAGAINTMACEAMMYDGKALQMGTSHELGQNFAEAFDITYQSKEGKLETCWTASWGVSTRMVGGLIMAHGDEKGLRLPPSIAPHQVVILVIREDDAVTQAAQTLAAELGDMGIRVEIDDNVDKSFGRRATDWEVKGVPIRIEVGPRDLENGEVTLARRDNATKQSVAVSDVAKQVPDLLDQIQSTLFDQAAKRMKDRTQTISTLAEAIEASQTGWARLPWDVLQDGGEEELKASSITVRALTRQDGSVPDNEKESDLIAIVGRSY